MNPLTIQSLINQLLVMQNKYGDLPIKVLHLEGSWDHARELKLEYPWDVNHFDTTRGPVGLAILSE